MTPKLIHTPDYLLAVDDSEIKKGDYRINIQREDITNRYLSNENDDNSSEIIEGYIEYDDCIINYKVEYHEDFGYSFMEITSYKVDEEYIDENYDDIKDEIINSISESSEGHSFEPIEYKYLVIDTRNGRTIATTDYKIDRKAASELYDIPKSFIEIKIVSK